MSKKSSTFARILTDIKKTYYIPTIETVKLEGLYPMAIGDTSGHSNMAPKRREDAVF